MKNMIANDSQRASAAAILAATAAATVRGDSTVDELVTRIRNPNADIRGEAWQNAGPYGAKAVKALAELMKDPDYQIARAGKRAIWNIVHYAGRPDAKEEALAVETELIALLKSEVETIEREALWMLSEIGGNRSVRPISRLLGNIKVRDDARMALQRIPGNRSLAALRSALAKAPEDFRYNQAEALRKRGVKIDEYPSEKLVPKTA